MGYSVGVVFLLCAPPYVASIPYSLAIAWFADKTHLRAPWIAFQAITCIIGLMIVEYHQNNGVRYFGIFLGVAGCMGNISTILAWQANNIRGQSVRAYVFLQGSTEKYAEFNSVASGLQIALGAIGGIYASTVFMQKEAPTYHSGIWATAVSQCLCSGYS